MLSFKGDHNEEIIHFPNGMCVKIDFGNKEHDDFGHFYSCRNHEHRRIRLFDENNNFISETIEENPYYNPLPGPLPDKFFEGMDPKVIF